MALEDCLKYASKGSAIMLYEDGIYAAMPGTAVSDRMSAVAGDYKVYVLKEDMQLRGVDKVMDGITQTDYTGFVDLVEEHKTASW
jgi:tRNA 2-thiouridine synthesizing protein B